jgi:hypothetical protein
MQGERSYPCSDMFVSSNVNQKYTAHSKNRYTLMKLQVLTIRLQHWVCAKSCCSSFFFLFWFWFIFLNVINIVYEITLPCLMYHTT